ncbi:MAG: ABC transporter ATP-binding protein [Agarilytica sp.]
MKTLLRLNNVHTHIGQYHILQGVSFEVPENSVTMLLGRNGAGKTTTLRTIMRMSLPSQGEALFDGEPLENTTTRDMALKGISYIPEKLGIFNSLTVEENMRVAAKHGPINEDRLSWIFGIFPEIKKFWFWPSERLSGGQKQMLAISRALVEPKRLILMDEPSRGLAPFIVDLLVEVLQELKQMKTTMLIVEHDFKFAQAVGDHVVVLNNGKVACTAPMENFAQSTSLQMEHLGLQLNQ